MSGKILIYGTITSPYVNRVILACKKKRLDYVLSMPEGGAKSPTITSINPLGKIPTIKDGRTVLFESGVILEYLDMKYTRPRLISQSIAMATKTRLISAMWENYVITMLIRLFVQCINENPDKVIIDESKQKLEYGLNALNSFVQPSNYASGKSFSLADCYGVSALTFLERVSVMLGDTKLLNKKPNLQKYWGEIKKDKSVAELLKEIKVAALTKK